MLRFCFLMIRDIVCSCVFWVLGVIFFWSSIFMKRRKFFRLFRGEGLFIVGF